MSNRASITITVIVILGLIIGWLWYEHKNEPKLAPATAATGIAPGPDKYWHHGDALLPNPQLSPGEVRTTDLNIICGESTKEFRHTSSALKRHVYEEYGEAPHERDCRDTTRISKKGNSVTEACEIDHIISLELGGADTAANLFPQPYNPPSGMGAHAKDRLENYLHDQVCHHGMPPAEAQKKISTDWYQAYLDAHLNQ